MKIQLKNIGWMVLFGALISFGSTSCSEDGGVWSPSCENDKIDGQETDVDCGGPECDTCGLGRWCIRDGDCQSGLCEESLCVGEVPASCQDDEKNGQETDMDCGGDECLPCGLGMHCDASSDCRSGNCELGRCVSSELCGNGRIDAYETCDGDCPISCDDSDDCTSDSLSGSAEDCTAKCVYAPITSCADGDGCCPTGCVGADDDCGELSIAFISPTDEDSAVVERDWTEVAASVSGEGQLSSFIDWNDSLLGRWSFDEGLGAVATDASSHANACDLVDGARWTQGKYAGALELDGTSSMTNCGNDPSLDTAEALTIEAWIKPSEAQEICWDGSHGNIGVMAKAFDGSGASWVLRYGAPDTCYLGFFFVGDPAPAWVTVGQPLESGQWHHVAATFDGSTVTSYLDGVPVETTPLTQLTTSSAPLLIGQDGWNNFFRGSVDEVRIFGRALSAQEILASYDTSQHALAHRFEGMSAGTFHYKASAIDTAGSTVSTELRSLTIDAQSDNIPVITVTGGTTSLQVGGTYAAPTVTAMDVEDGDITADIVVGGDTVDPNTAGTYTVTYDVTDSDGNAAEQKSHTVTVVFGGGDCTVITGLQSGETVSAAQNNSNVLNAALAGGNVDLCIPTGTWFTDDEIIVNYNTIISFDEGAKLEQIYPTTGDAQSTPINVSLMRILGGSVTLNNPHLDMGGQQRCWRIETHSGTHATLVIFGLHNTGNITINGGIIEGGSSNNFQGGRNNTVFNGTTFRNSREHLIYANGKFGDGAGVDDADGLTFNYCTFENPGVGGDKWESNHIQIRSYKNVVINHCAVKGVEDTDGTNYAILSSGVRGLRVNDCTFEDFTGGVIWKGKAYAEEHEPTDHVFTNCIFTGASGSWAIERGTSSTEIVFNNCTFNRLGRVYTWARFDSCSFVATNDTIISMNSASTTFDSCTWNASGSTKTRFLEKFDYENVVGIPFSSEAEALTRNTFIGSQTKINPTDGHAFDWSPIP